MSNSTTKKVTVTNVLVDAPADKELTVVATEENMEDLGRTFKLSTPLNVGDREISEISLDFRKLTGDEIDQLEQDYFKQYKGSANYIAPAMDKRFVRMAISKLNKFPFPFLGYLNAEDYIGCTQRGFSFLGSKVD
jgi:hypothetical protein